MTSEQAQTPEFPGFPDFRANVTFVPIQFFTVVIPHCSRGTVRIVGYALRKVLGWVDEHGNPTREQLRFTYNELIEKAGVSRESIPEALNEALTTCCLRCLQSPQPARSGQQAQSGIYELCWDEEGRYTDSPADFRGFYFPEAAVMPVEEGPHAVQRPKAARKNIPNAFFDYLLPRERLSVIRVVGALLFYSIQWGPGGERKVPVTKSITELSRLTKLSRQHVHEAVVHARECGYIEQKDGGCFDPAAGKESRAATYGIRWIAAALPGHLLPSGAEHEPGPPVRKGEREAPERSEKVHGTAVGKGERNQSENVNGERSEMVNGISVKTELKKEQTTAAAVALTSGSAGKVAAAESSFILLTKVGFDETTARRLAQAHSQKVIRRQIEWLAKRTPNRNRLGFLRRAIEQDWPEPEGEGTTEQSIDPSWELAKLFASHYYAAYHGFEGEAGTEPFPKDIERTVKFISRLTVQENNEDRVPEWGRRFGRLVRDNHQNQRNAKPNLSFTLVLYGDKFLSMLQREGVARAREALGKAREAHQTEYLPAYVAYLRLAEEGLKQASSSIYKDFVNHRQRIRHRLTTSPFLPSGARLACFDSDENRLLDFAEFCREAPKQLVLGFWQWDARLNPRRFGSASNATNLEEAQP